MCKFEDNHTVQFWIFKIDNFCPLRDQQTIDTHQHKRVVIFFRHDHHLSLLIDNSSLGAEHSEDSCITSQRSALSEEEGAYISIYYMVNKLQDLSNCAVQFHR